MQSSDPTTTMEEEGVAPPALRLVNFISEEQLDKAKKTRGERVEDGTAQRDRPLYEILKENKDRKDAEFNERFKHRPPKALDEDETEFLDNLEMMSTVLKDIYLLGFYETLKSRREHERQLANEEAEQLRRFQEAVAAQSNIVRELKETPTVSKPEENKPIDKKTQHFRPANFIIAVKPQTKKAKTEAASEKQPLEPSNGAQVDEKPPDAAESALGGLVSYSDESEYDN